MNSVNDLGSVLQWSTRAADIFFSTLTDIFQDIKVFSLAMYSVLYNVVFVSGCLHYYILSYWNDILHV